MKALEQNYRNGVLQLVEIPAPRPAPGCVTVRTVASLASVGTERGMIELARKSLLGKALARPDLVQQVWLKAKAEGPLEAWRQAWGRLNVPILLGYSSAGEVLEVGPDVVTYRPGDRVACAGSGVAGHVEITLVPVNLCTPIPREVTCEQASFVAIGGIALEAVRVSHVTLGERVVVIGLGLIGQMTVRLLKAAGCHVFGIDRDPAKNALALTSGAEATADPHDPQSAAAQVRAWSVTDGADAVIIAAATQSNEPLELAAQLSRERGRIVVTGVVGMEVPRRAFYEKELELIVSRAWGPGLYDPAYAQKGLDYPIAHARWTSRRNMAEFIAQLARKAVLVDDLISHRFPIDDAPRAYEMILAGKEPCIGVVIEYPGTVETPAVSTPVHSAVAQVDANARSSAAGSVVWLKPAARQRPVVPGQVGIGVIGAGQFAAGTMLPLVGRLRDVALRGIATRTGLSGRTAAERYGFDYSTSDYHELLADSSIDLILVLTRHDSHAQLASDALAADKNVFVEKPLAISRNQLRTIVAAYEAATARTPDQGAPVLMVGFNRRFSPHSTWLKSRLGGLAGPLSIAITVNAGRLDPGSWLADRDSGGGRVIGEVCHFVDLVQFLTESTPETAFARRIGELAPPEDDSVLCTLSLANGSIAQISYFAMGDRAHPRERIEVFGAGAVGVIDNFKSARIVRAGRTRSHRNILAVDRGHRGELEVLMNAVRHRCARLSSPSSAAASTDQSTVVPFQEYVSTTLTTLALEESLAGGRPEKLGRA